MQAKHALHAMRVRNSRHALHVSLHNIPAGTWVHSPSPTAWPRPRPSARLATATGSQHVQSHVDTRPPRAPRCAVTRLACVAWLSTYLSGNSLRVHSYR